MRMMSKKKKKKNVFAKLNRTFSSITTNRNYYTTYLLTYTEKIHTHTQSFQINSSSILTRLFPLCLTEFFVKVVMTLGFGIKILNPIYC